MAVTEWKVINESSMAGAYTVDHSLDGWFLYRAWPIAETSLSKWLMEQVDYIKPPEPTSGLPRPELGQGWPVWSASPTQVGAGGLQVVRMTQAEYAALPWDPEFKACCSICLMPRRL